MNEALECSPNYPHTRLSTITRSHVRDSDFRLITKEVKASDTDIVFEESSVDSSVGREQKEARSHLALLERRQLRPKKSTAVRKSLHSAVDWLRLDFKFVDQQISDADTSGASPGIREPTLSVRPSQRGYRLVVKKRVLRVLRFVGASSR